MMLLNIGDYDQNIYHTIYIISQNIINIVWMSFMKMKVIQQFLISNFYNFYNCINSENLKHL
jgi:hypothetical protein